MDKQTFSAAVLDCEQTLYRVSMSILKNEKDCEDAVQDAILAAFQKRDTLKHEEYFKTWLVRILINVCNRQLKKKGKAIPTDELTLESTDNCEKRTELHMALDNLNPKLRTVIVMYYIEGFSVKEIKSILRIPEGTVKSRLSKGRSELKLQLE
ncbi:MAG: sigma-70 family RNA polymerase sigma factor [Lachnospiraceae bacterium]|nr:sigma-70 family RNA polymerase sigma factor [Lachnospiraceae bacterium]